MANKYVLDACALFAFIYGEPGFDVVRYILKQTDDDDVEVFMNKLNLFEVFYGIRRTEGLPAAEGIYNTIMKLPIQIINGISDEVFLEASRIKSLYKMSLADSIALAEAYVMGASIITADHHELDTVDRNEDINFTWIR